MTQMQRAAADAILMSQPLIEYRCRIVCVCGNQWIEPSVHNTSKRLDECTCPFPADEDQPETDDSLNRHHEHIYESDRI